MPVEKSVYTTLAKAWYVIYPLDPYALGPYRYEDFVPATRAVEDATAAFGEAPSGAWSDGPVKTVEEYEVELAA